MTRTTALNVISVLMIACAAIVSLTSIYLTRRPIDLRDTEALTGQRTVVVVLTIVAVCMAILGAAIRLKVRHAARKEPNDEHKPA